MKLKKCVLSVWHKLTFSSIKEYDVSVISFYDDFFYKSIRKKQGANKNV